MGLKTRVEVETVSGNKMLAMHHMERYRLGQKQKRLVGWALLLNKRDKPELPVVVRLTRESKGRLDDDNLSTAMKYVRDEIARFMGVDDGKVDLIRFEYAQRHGPAHAVEIEIEGRA